MLEVPRVVREGPRAALACGGGCAEVGPEWWGCRLYTFRDFWQCFEVLWRDKGDGAGAKPQNPTSQHPANRPVKPLSPNSETSCGPFRNTSESVSVLAIQIGVPLNAPTRRCVLTPRRPGSAHRPVNERPCGRGNS